MNQQHLKDNNTFLDFISDCYEMGIEPSINEPDYFKLMQLRALNDKLDKIIELLEKDKTCLTE